MCGLAERCRVCVLVLPGLALDDSMGERVAPCDGKCQALLELEDFLGQPLGRYLAVLFFYFDADGATA
jgi:hypothetical protein